MAFYKIRQKALSLLAAKDKFSDLRSFPLLKDLTDHELSLFSGIVHERHFKEGEMIYQEEFPLAVIYLIQSGSIEITDQIPDGDASIVRKKHQFIGIIDLYYENKRKGEAHALKDSVLLAVSHLDFNAFIHANPRAGVKILNNICGALSRYIINEPHHPVE